MSEPDLWQKYKAVWITLIVIGVVGLVAGGVVLYLHYGPGLGGKAKPSPSTSVPTCSTGQHVCNGKCCSASNTVNGSCVCSDQCQTNIVCQVNATSVCCPVNYHCGNDEGQCCPNDGSGNCIAGTIMS